MKFSGKELFDIGVPQNKIKFFVGRHFVSKEELLAELNTPKEVKIVAENTISDWIVKTFPHLPMTMNGEKPIKMSKSELRRIMDSGGILINGRNPKSDETFLETDFPITEFVWFPKSKRKTTWV